MSTLAGSTVPEPSQWSIDYEYRGGSYQALSGNPIWLKPRSTAKRIIQLSWTGLSTAERNTLKTVFASMFAGTVAYVDTLSNSYTVQPSIQNPDLRFSAVLNNGTAVWSAQLELREY